MNRYLLLCFLLAFAFTATAKNKIVVELYALDVEPKGLLVFYTAFFILPDSSHAKASCLLNIHDNKTCKIEPFKAEQRSPDACDSKNHCIYKEKYSAERKGNDITLYAGNGKVTYHIQSSW